MRGFDRMHRGSRHRSACDGRSDLNPQMCERGRNRPELGAKLKRVAADILDLSFWACSPTQPSLCMSGRLRWCCSHAPHSSSVHPLPSDHRCWRRCCCKSGRRGRSSSSRLPRPDLFHLLHRGCVVACRGSRSPSTTREVLCSLGSKGLRGVPLDTQKVAPLLPSRG